MARDLPRLPRVALIEHLADGLAAILDAEHIDQSALLGASFGGAVAQVFVHKHPRKINKLILSNTGVPLRRLIPAVWLSSAVTRLTSWATLSKLLQRGLIKALATPEHEREFWHAYFDELLTARLTKADVVANVRQQLEYRRCFHFSADDLPEWNGRVLILESYTDIIGPSRRRALRETYPHAELHIFQNAGHAPMFTRPDEYLAIVKQFLA